MADNPPRGSGNNEEEGKGGPPARLPPRRVYRYTDGDEEEEEEGREEEETTEGGGGGGGGTGRGEEERPPSSETDQLEVELTELVRDDRKTATLTAPRNETPETKATAVAVTDEHIRMQFQSEMINGRSWPFRFPPPPLPFSQTTVSESPLLLRHIAPESSVDLYVKAIQLMKSIYDSAADLASRYWRRATVLDNDLMSFFACAEQLDELAEIIGLLFVDSDAIRSNITEWMLQINMVNLSESYKSRRREARGMLLSTVPPSAEINKFVRKLATFSTDIKSIHAIIRSSMQERVQRGIPCRILALPKNPDEKVGGWVMPGISTAVTGEAAETGADERFYASRISGGDDDDDDKKVTPNPTNYHGTRFPAFDEYDLYGQRNDAFALCPPICYALDYTGMDNATYDRDMMVQLDRIAFKEFPQYQAGLVWYQNHMKLQQYHLESTVEVETLPGRSSLSTPFPVTVLWDTKSEWPQYWTDITDPNFEFELQNYVEAVTRFAATMSQLCKHFFMLLAETFKDDEKSTEFRSLQLLQARHTKAISTWPTKPKFEHRPRMTDLNEYIVKVGNVALEASQIYRDARGVLTMNTLEEQELDNAAYTAMVHEWLAMQSHYTLEEQVTEQAYQRFSKAALTEGKDGQEAKLYLGQLERYHSAIYSYRGDAQLELTDRLRVLQKKAQLNSLAWALSIDRPRTRSHKFILYGVGMPRMDVSSGQICSNVQFHRVALRFLLDTGQDGTMYDSYLDTFLVRSTAALIVVICQFYRCLQRARKFTATGHGAASTQDVCRARALYSDIKSLQSVVIYADTISTTRVNTLRETLDRFQTAADAWDIKEAEQKAAFEASRAGNWLGRNRSEESKEKQRESKRAYNTWVNYNPRPGNGTRTLLESLERSRREFQQNIEALLSIEVGLKRSEVESSSSSSSSSTPRRLVYDIIMTCVDIKRFVYAWPHLRREMVRSEPSDPNLLRDRLGAVVVGMDANNLGIMTGPHRAGGHGVAYFDALDHVPSQTPVTRLSVSIQASRNARRMQLLEHLNLMATRRKSVSPDIVASIQTELAYIQKCEITSAVDITVVVKLNTVIIRPEVVDVIQRLKTILIPNNVTALDDYPTTEGKTESKAKPDAAVVTLFFCDRRLAVKRDGIKRPYVEILLIRDGPEIDVSRSRIDHPAPLKLVYRKGGGDIAGVEHLVNISTIQRLADAVLRANQGRNGTLNRTGAMAFDETSELPEWE
jgi:hypothetical protein